MTNNSYQEPILEDYYCREEERCDSELESEDDEWAGTEKPLVSPAGFIMSLLRWSATIGIYKRIGFSDDISNLSVCYVECPSGA